MKTAIAALEPHIPTSLRARFRQDLRKLRNTGVETVEDLSALLSSSRAGREPRVIACWLLGIARQPSSVPKLILAHKTKDRAIMWESAKALANMGGALVLKMFLDELRKATERERKIAAAWALGIMNAKRAVPTLIATLADYRPPPELRSEAAEALGNLSATRAVPVLLKATFDPSPKVRFWSVFALGQIGDGRALQRLREVASSDRTRLKGWGLINREASFAIKQLSRQRK